MTAKVPASKSGVTVFVLLNPVDVTRLKGRKLSIGSHGYAQVCLPTSRVALLHRWLLGLERGDKRIGDHINGDPLDCRRSNLRIVDAVASSCNTRGWSSAGYRGVYRRRHGKPFEAHATVAGERTIVGRFDTAEEADEAVHLWRLAHMPGYVDRPGARCVGAVREPDPDTAWWQILEFANGPSRRWNLPTVEVKYRERMGHDPSDDLATGWMYDAFLDALKNGQVQ